MKQTTKKQIGAIAVVVSMAFVLGAGTALAESSNVTVTWIVPGDTTIVVAFPSGQGKIEFDATAQGQNFTNQKATGTSSGTAAIRVTNQGNQDLDITFNFTAFPTGVDHVNFSTAWASNTTSWQFSDGTESTPQTMVSSLSQGVSEEWWAWSSGTEMPATTGTDDTMQVNSAAS